MLIHTHMAQEPGMLEELLVYSRDTCILTCLHTHATLACEQTFWGFRPKPRRQTSERHTQNKRCCVTQTSQTDQTLQTSSFLFHKREYMTPTRVCMYMCNHAHLMYACRCTQVCFFFSTSVRILFVRYGRRFSIV